MSKALIHWLIKDECWCFRCRSVRRSEAAQVKTLLALIKGVKRHIDAYGYWLPSEDERQSMRVAIATIEGGKS